ncbi:MAG: glycosyltransferase, partial [Caldisericaceae bacterium]|nr:glycosyltransferase [Caldisericaceae bacterium]
MILIISGMHRSGTSLLARALNQLGVYLGPQEKLIPAAEDNPEGFWEHIGFLKINEELLYNFGGAWDFIPKFPENWQDLPELEPFYDRANGLISEFKDRPLWGWKDPRNSLTLPFWKKLLPDAKLVFMIRHPLEVANSLNKRNFFSILNGLNLWKKYNEHWLNAAENSNICVVHYESILFNPEKELKRIAEKLQLDFTSGQWEEAKSVIKPNLKHHWVGQNSTDFEKRFPEVNKLYRELCCLAEYDPVTNKKLRHEFKNKIQPSVKKTNLTKKNNTHEKPLISIVIPLFNKLELTHQCLKSILQNTRYPNYELIFVDNDSTDETRAYLQKLKLSNVKTIFNEQNLGFVEGCNKGAEYAEGDFILFLNNDTQVTPGWLEALVNIMRHYPDCGIVGSKLVYPNGKLQEAGGIIFSDGNGWNYGKGMNPDDPRFNFVREVDYVSGASLMIRKSLWQKIGGFDQRYAPAYYEDTDLCFTAREHGFKVLYQPESVVIHFEGQTAGTNLNSGFKKFQQINRQKFVQKWKEQLKKQYENNPRNVPLASQRNVNQRILICDPLMPMWDRASGSLRLFNYIKILKKLGNHITFLARVGSTDTKYKKTLQQLGIEVYE